jgi:hypothetical protein
MLWTLLLNTFGPTLQLLQASLDIPCPKFVGGLFYYDLNCNWKFLQFLSSTSSGACISFSNLVYRKHGDRQIIRLSTNFGFQAVSAMSVASNREFFSVPDLSARVSKDCRLGDHACLLSHVAEEK